MKGREKIEILKNSNQTTQARSPSPRTGRQKINTYKNSFTKSTKSKYNVSSSIKKKIKSNKNCSLESEINRPLFENIEDENKSYQILASNVRVQNKILEEYQKWINILLSVIDNEKINNTYNDIGTPIQQALQYIEKLKIENFDIKTLIINKKIHNEKIQKILDHKQKSQNMVIKEFNEKDKSNGLNIKREKEQLILNVQMLANELDELNENNKQLYDKIQKDKNLKKIYDLLIIKNQLKEENKLYKKIMVFKNRKNYIDLKESIPSNSINITDLKNKNYDKKRNKIYNSNNIATRNYGSIGPISGYGEYKLEKEENINSHESIFFCGL